MSNTGSGAGPEENAWRLYQTTMEWVRHADAKVTALFAANVTLIAGVLTMEKVSGLNPWWATATLAAAGLSLLLAGWAVLPSLRTSSPSTSLVFFDHAARKHPTSATYLTAHQELMANPDKLVADLAEQTWNLARVASSKFKWTGFSVFVFLGAAVSAAVMFVLEVW